MKSPLAALAGSTLLLLACSAASPAPAPPAAPEQTPALAPDEQTTPLPTEPAARPDACGAVPRSQCSPANEGSVVRGIVRFDPKHFVGKKAPSLRVFLHHQFVFSPDEVKQGGHPHAFSTAAAKVDVDKGEVPFTIDLCAFGTAMWSEENCGFNLLVMLDEDGSNDPDAAGVAGLVPQKGELVKMVPLDVSCHAKSQCVVLDADCTDGEACARYTPPRTCACAANGCASDDAICKLK